MKTNISQLKNPLIFWLIILITFTSVFPLYHHYESPVHFSHFYSIDPDPDSVYLNQLKTDTIYQSIQQKIDSINHLTDLQNLPEQGGVNLIELLGLYSYMYCDSCDDANPNKSSYKKTPHYYLNLKDIAPKKDSFATIHKPIYFWKKGKFYLKKLTLLNITTQEKNPLYHLSWVTKEINYGIETVQNTQSKEDLVNLLIPVSKFTYYVLTVLFVLIIVAVLLIYFQFLLSPFIYVLYRISKGYPFAKKNYRQLFYMAYVLIGTPVLLFILKLIAFISCKSYFANDFGFYFNWNYFINRTSH
jgi:hypothetical protein